VPSPYKKPNSSNYWVRIAVPKDLKAKVGSGEIHKSLDTPDEAEAAIRAAEFSIKWKRDFKALRERIASEELAQAPELVDRFLEGLEARTFGDLDAAIYAMQKMLTVQLLTAWGPDEYQSRRADLALGFMPADEDWENWTDPEVADVIPEQDRDKLIARLRLLHHNPLTFGAGFRDALQHIRNGRRWDVMNMQVFMVGESTNTPIERGSALYDAVAEALLDRLLNHHSHRWDPELLAACVLPDLSQGVDSASPLPSPSALPPTALPEPVQPPPVPTLRTSKGMQPLSAALQRWQEVQRPGKSAIIEGTRAVARFIELFGDKPVALITKAEVLEYRDFLESMPANLPLPKIQEAGVSLREAVAKAIAEKPERKKLSPGAVKKDVAALAAILSAMQGELWIDTNPAAGVKVSGYSKKKKGQRNPRLPLKPSMMRTLFASPLFTGCSGKGVAARAKQGSHVFQDELYWTFLFGATAGPRLEEVGQVLLDDIEVVDVPLGDPIIGIYVTGTGADQSVKTDESMRVIIVHPKLVQLGFLEFVKKRRAAGATRLFDLEQSARGSWTKELSRRLNRYFDRTVTDDPRYVWYSMRHEFADRSEVSVSAEVSKKIMGHARGRLYGLGAPLRHAAQELEKIDVSFIDWNRLMTAAGRHPQQELF